MTRVLMVAVLMAGLAGTPAVEAAGTQGSATLAEQYLLSAANQERAALGLRPLVRNPLLARAAGEHALEMASHRAIAHAFSGEPELATRAATAGVRFSVISENVGEAPSPLTIHELWMHSPHHRENLLDPKVDSAGIAVVARNGELYAVEDFAKTVRRVSFPEQEAAIAQLVAQRGVAVSSSATSVAAARATCELASGYAGARKPWFVMRFTSDTLGALPAELTSRIASGRFHEAAVGACAPDANGPFASYNLAVLLYP